MTQFKGTRCENSGLKKIKLDPLLTFFKNCLKNKQFKKTLSIENNFAARGTQNHPRVPPKFVTNPTVESSSEVVQVYPLQVLE